MSISKFEAAVIYDYRNRKTKIKDVLQYLVLDLDECSLGICLCDAKGETRLVDSYAVSGNHNLWHDCVSEVKKFLGNQYIFDVQQEMINQIKTSNNAVENYLRSDRVFDPCMFRFSENTISCSEFENCIQQVKQNLYALFDEVSKRISRDTIPDIKIIVLGYAQELYLTDYYIRDYFSAEPFLADDRFVNSMFQDHYSKVVEIGMEYYMEKNNVNHTYTLILLDKQSETIEEICFIKKGQSKKALEELQYIGPIYLSGDETVSIQVDSEITNIRIPYSFMPVHDDLIDVAIGMKDDLPNLFIRRCRFPAQVYNVELV